MTYYARITDSGEVVLPDELARELELRPGGLLEIEREDGKLILKSYAQVVKDLQAKFRAMLPADYTGSMVDELIAERRAEAAREDADHERWLRGRSDG